MKNYDEGDNKFKKTLVWMGAIAASLSIGFAIGMYMGTAQIINVTVGLKAADNTKTLNIKKEGV